MLDRLAVIGFDAQLDGLDNVDQVAAAFYQGEIAEPQSQFDAHNLQSLCASAVQRISQATALDKAQLAVIMIALQPLTLIAQSSYLQCTTVTSLADALLLTANLIEQLQAPVLLIASHFAEQPSAEQATTISFDPHFSGYGQRSGVAALLLASEQFAVSHEHYIYSYLSGLAVCDDLTKIAQTIDQSFIQTGLTTQQISAIEVSAASEPALQAAEQQVLLSAYQNGLSLHTAVSCIKSVVGDSGELAQLCGLLNAIFALQQRYYGAIKHWNGPQQGQLAAWRASPFYLLNECAPVFPTNDRAARNIAYSGLTSERYAHLIIQENSDRQVRTNGYLANSPDTLFIITGASAAQLHAQLSELHDAVVNGDLKFLAQQAYQRFLASPSGQLQLVLIGSSKTQLQQQINLALAGITTALANNQDWKTPQGSYLCVNPSPSRQTAFIYPGIGATYLGLGRDLLQFFPDIYPYLEQLFAHPAAQAKYQLLYPRSLTRLSFSELKQHDLQLRSQLADIAECGVGYGCVFTRIFIDLLNLKANFAAGYSMGEVSMFAALNCWQNPGQMSARLASSAVFNKQLAGELQTVRTLWQLPQQAQSTEIWESYNIKGNVGSVSAAILPGERVYITLINCTDSLVIAGFPNDCLAVANRLGVRALALNVHNAIHCPPASEQYQQLIELYSMDLAAPIDCKLYSSSCYLAIPFSQRAIAVSIAKCLCERVDFPRLVNTLVTQGAEIFIEMGAGRSLTTWTDKIVAQCAPDHPIMTVAVNGKGSNQQRMLLQAVAKLISSGVELDLTRFFYGSIVAPSKQ